MLKKVLVAIVVIIVGLLIVIAIQPSNFRITRSGKIAAPPDAVFPHVNDFHKWQAWSPWEKLDPQLKRTYDGPEAGSGATYGWSGNDEVGEGRMTITESVPSELIKIRLEFIKPFAATNTTEFTFKPEGKETLVTWTMEGKNNFMGKAFCLFMNMDKMIGGSFEEGLANMKSAVEGGTKATHEAAKPEADEQAPATASDNPSPEAEKPADESENPAE